LNTAASGSFVTSGERALPTGPAPVPLEGEPLFHLAERQDVVGGFSRSGKLPEPGGLL
jgi:hypothetical protein